MTGTPACRGTGGIGAPGRAKVRRLGAAVHQAKTWPVPRRVAVKAEILTKGANTRFVVTNHPEGPDVMYQGYTDRGACENGIQDLKRGLRAERLRCHRFAVNQFRLLLHAAAYCLLDRLRRVLVKIGGGVRQQVSRVSLHLAAAHPGQSLWVLLAAGIPYE